MTTPAEVIECCRHLPGIAVGQASCRACVTLAVDAAIAPHCTAWRDLRRGASVAEEQYKGWTIRTLSYLSVGDRWRPLALVRTYDVGSVILHQVPAPLDVMFDTKQEAEAYAVKMAQKWVDDRG